MKAPKGRLRRKQKAIDEKKNSKQDDKLQALLNCCKHERCRTFSGLPQSQNMSSKVTMHSDPCKMKLVNVNFTYQTNKKTNEREEKKENL